MPTSLSGYVPGLQTRQHCAIYPAPIIHRVNLNELSHREVLRAIAGSMANTVLILKGGSALHLAYRLNCSAVDLNFDSTEKLKLGHRIAAALPRYNPLIALDVEAETDDMIQYRLRYAELENEHSLKIEISHRNQIEANHVTRVNGIRTYTPAHLLALKLQDMENKPMAGDIQDLAAVAEKCPDAFTSSNVEALHRLLERQRAFEGETGISSHEIQAMMGTLREIARFRREGGLSVRVGTRPD